MNISPYLRGILVTVGRDIKPALATPQAKLRAELVEMVLARLIADNEAPADLAAPGDAASATLIARIEARRTGHHDEAGDTTLVRIVAATECARRDRVEELVADVAARAATEAAEAPKHGAMTVAAVTDYLRQRFPEKAVIAATKVATIPGGRSKGTTLVEVSGGDRGEIVLRQDLAVAPGGQPVGYEFPLIAAAWQAGLVVPEPLWIEPGPNALGGPFIAFARASGKPGGTLFRMDAPASVARDLAAFFGKLHSIDLDGSGLRGVLMWGDLDDPVRPLLDMFYGQWRACSRGAVPLIEAAFLWLYDHLHVVEAGRAVHGDSCFHNILMEDGRMTAMLDWEFAHAGDPAEDLMGCAHFVERVMPWEDFLAVYREHGGQEISRERQDFFSLWRSLRFAISCARAGDAFESGRSDDLLLGSSGYNSHARLLHDVAQQLERITR